MRSAPSTRHWARAWSRLGSARDSGVFQAISEAEHDPVDLLLRHVTGDWGDLEDEDKVEN